MRELSTRPGDAFSATVSRVFRSSLLIRLGYVQPLVIPACAHALSGLASACVFGSSESHGRHRTQQHVSALVICTSTIRSCHPKTTCMGEMDAAITLRRRGSDISRSCQCHASIWTAYAPAMYAHDGNLHVKNVMRRCAQHLSSCCSSASSNVELPPFSLTG